MRIMTLININMSGAKDEIFFIYFTFVLDIKKTNKMKFYFYLYYLIYKVTKSVLTWLYEISPLTPRDKSKRKGEETLKLQIMMASKSALAFGEVLYTVCLFIFIYLLGFKQITILAKKENMYYVLIPCIIVSLAIEYFLFQRNNRYKRCSEEFDKFTFEQKFLYGSGALFLFLLPIILLIYEISWL